MFKQRLSIVVIVTVVALGGVACRPRQAMGPGRGSFVPQVVVQEAKRQAVAETLSLVGSLAANEAVEIKLETEGVVQDVLFQEGQQVTNSQLLLRLDETKFAATLAAAEANFKLSEANFARGQQLFQDKLISSQEFDQNQATFAYNQASLELMKRQLKDARVRAPFDGIIGARLVSPGQVVNRLTVLTTLVDLDPVKVELNVPERFLGQLELGQALEIAVAAHPGRKFIGKVYFIAAQLDTATRTALVKARIPNPKQELRPGMFASLELTLRLRDSAIVVPETALMYDGDSARVFVVATNETAKLQPVRLGVRLPGLVEVTEGLAGGERVIIEGVQKVVPDAKVRPVAAEGAASPGPAASGGGGGHSAGGP